ncbi:heavy metal translocatin [Pholiota conissans]|uniref:Heavy metal translocatin n=1 Tax=Pholiota conissans TaxID=109636 RepID=A0A9P6CXZ2_9AGAR|nr:heavy metal translocatin [Pholiota conissans]
MPQLLASAPLGETAISNGDGHLDTRTTVLISNLHCGSCVQTIEDSLSALSPPPTSVQVSIVSQSVSYHCPKGLSPNTVQITLENAGFDIFTGPFPSLGSGNTSSDRHRKHKQQCILCQKEGSSTGDDLRGTHDSGTHVDSSTLHSTFDSKMPHHDATFSKLTEVYSQTDREIAASLPDKSEEGPLRVTLSIGGMTCSSCSGTITKMLSDLQGVSEIAVNFLGKSATLLVDRRQRVDEVVETVEDCGFEVEVMSVETPTSMNSDSAANGLRTVTLHVDGMFCERCPEKLIAAVESLGSQVKIVKPITSYTDGLLELSYRASPPTFTIRTILSFLSSATPFRVSLYRPPSLEERTRSMQAKEQYSLLSRLLLVVIISIPTFIIGVAYMSLVKESDATKKFLMEPMWTGNTSRIQWALFFLATPVQFYSANIFHLRSLQEIRSLWRRGNSTPIYRRFIRFGSMNLLVSSGVSVAYFSSIALLGLAAAQPASPSGVGDTTTYFDSVVFLTMFLLAGRFIESYSKARTADAISALGKLRPAEALLLTEKMPYKEFGKDVKLESAQNAELGSSIERIDATLLEVGDIVRIQSGSTPPADATVISGTESAFDESSLTGESKLVKKAVGDKIFLGTINKGGMVDARVDAVGGATMLDHIVKVVREGQTHRAPIERVADLLTGYFVPVVTLLAIITWVVWLGLGLSGALPQDYLDIPLGGWTVWSLEFAIAVFVVACPCGIALAAPTALLVGSGLAAQFGILARGGGEAFQEMAQVDIVVFDKTGTLTEGGEPKVSDFELLASDARREVAFGIALSMESASSHPLAAAIRSFCEAQGVTSASQGSAFEEKAGRGLKARFEDHHCVAIIGNEAWLEEHGCVVDGAVDQKLSTWKSEAKSIVLLALCDDSERSGKAQVFVPVAIFAVTDRLRPEARSVVSSLQNQGIGTWMISGDNVLSARAVAQRVGIPAEHVIAGVLPHEKAYKVQWLQQVGAKRIQPHWRRIFKKRRLNERCIVAMVGDGINDAPALVAADIGVAIGSGSDVAISSASFILLSSNLQSLLTLADLSRTVFNRVKFNFLYAAMYNCVALPIAAGVVYPAGHVRLAPVWASLAMALSSVSVVCSSLLLKLYKEPKVSGHGVN